MEVLSANDMTPVQASGFSPFRRFTDLKLMVKLPLIIVGMVIVSSLALTTTSYLDARAIMKDEIRSRFIATVESTKRAMTDFLEESEADLKAQADSPTTSAALNAFTLSFRAMGDAPGRALRTEYIDNNPNPVGQKDAMRSSGSSTQYDLVHTKYHPILRSLLQARGYYDVFLVDRAGNVVYTVFKERDFATNLRDGPWRDTDLAVAWREAGTLGADAVAFTDFREYPPSEDVPASFIATQVSGPDGEAIGTLIFQLPIDQISTLANETSGLGETGEVLIVGEDKRLRNRSRHEGGPGILEPVGDRPVIQLALNGAEAHFVSGISFGGEPVEMIADLVDFHGSRWVVAVEQSTAELMAPIATLRNQLAIQAIALIGLVAVVGFFAGRSISRPFAGLGRELDRMAEGELGRPIPFRDRKDDVGALSRNLENLRNRLTAAASEREERERQAEDQRIVVEQLTAGIANLAEGDLTTRIDMTFAPDYEALRTGFNSAVARLNETIASLVAAAREIDGNAREVENASNDLSQKAIEQAANLEQTAAAITELSASVKSTADAAGDADRVMTRARTDAEASGQEVNRAMSAMDRISNSSQKITQVTSVIEDLAFQTNLLALNAGVEAARAGEAGRGFAVVASEVRALAQRSSDAAKEINSLIQESASNVVSGVELVEKAGKSFEGMIGDFEKVSASVSAIAAAAREQSMGLEEINSAVDQLDGVTQKNASVATQVHGTGKIMVSEAAKLNQVSARFRIDGSVVRSGPGTVHRAPQAVPARLVANAPQIATAKDVSDEIWAEF